MKHRKFRRFLTTILLISPLIGGCVFSFPERHIRDFRAELGHPYDGAVIGLEETFVTGKVFHTGWELSRMVFYANGRRIGETASLEAIPDDGASFGEINWTPPEAGEYLLQVEGHSLDGADVISAAVRICVVGFKVGGDNYVWPYGYEGPCDLSAREPGARPGPITFSARAAPESLTYDDFLREPRCPIDTEASVSFEARVQDPPDDIVLVVVYYSMTFAPGTSSAGRTSNHAIVLTHTADVDPDIELYTGTTEELSPELTNYFYTVGFGEIVWSARAFDRAGAIVQEAGPYTIPVTASCGPLGTATSPVPTATATLEPSEANCPPGTYYAPATNQCIAIEIPSPKPDGKNCSDYGNLNSCTEAGCAWDGQTQSCK